jgi:hypothetical protein
LAWPLRLRQGGIELTPVHVNFSFSKYVTATRQTMSATDYVSEDYVSEMNAVGTCVVASRAGRRSVACLALSLFV